MGDMNFPDPSASPHEGWEWDGEKWAKLIDAGEPKVQVIASGAMATGDMVVVNADGTVSVITGSPAGLTNTATLSDAITEHVSSVYDPDSDKVVVAYSIGAVNKSYAVVGTVSGDTISFGPPKQFRAKQSWWISCSYNTLAQRVVLAYYATSTGKCAAIVGEVSGDSINFGPEAENETMKGSDAGLSIAYSAADDKHVIAYTSNSSSYGTAVVASVRPSNNTITFGTPVRFASVAVPNISTTFCTASDKAVITYMDGSDSDQGRVTVGTISGDSISFGSAVPIGVVCRDVASACDEASGKVVVSYVDRDNNNSCNAIVGTVSGNSISFGAPDIFLSVGGTTVDCAYDSVNGGLVFVSSDQNGVGRSMLGNVSGGIGFSDETTFAPKARETSIAVGNGKVAFSYWDSSDGYVAKSTGYTPPSTSLTSENFIGVSKGDYSDGDEAIVQVAGINADQQGMTVGAQYVQRDGTLETTKGAPSVFAGTAISPTELNIKDLV